MITKDTKITRKKGEKLAEQENKKTIQVSRWFWSLEKDMFGAANVVR